MGHVWYFLNCSQMWQVCHKLILKQMLYIFKNCIQIQHVSTQRDSDSDSFICHCVKHIGICFGMTCVHPYSFFTCNNKYRHHKTTKTTTRARKINTVQVMGLVQTMSGDTLPRGQGREGDQSHLAAWQLRGRNSVYDGTLWPSGASTFSQREAE